MTPRKLAIPRRHRIRTPGAELSPAGSGDRVAPLGRADIVADLARPLPVAVIAELLGTPREHRTDLHRWSRTVVAAPATGEAFAGHRRALHEVRDYLQEIIGLKRREPDGGLVSALIEARDEESGELLLTDEELQSTIFLLLFAGLENVGDLISNGTLALLRNPDQLVRLRQDPGLLPTAVDEFLRYDSPGNITTWRFALEDVDLGGAAVRRGEPVLVAMPAVNRDPARFPDPHRLDLERTDNPHISFGHGVHHCPGLHLARLEGEVAIGTILRRLPDLELAVPVEELVYKPSVLVRGLEALPVRFTPDLSGAAGCPGRNGPGPAAAVRDGRRPAPPTHRGPWFFLAATGALAHA